MARVEALRAAVLPEAPDPIGVAGSTDKMKQEVAPILNAAAESIDLMGSSCSPATLTSSASVSNFWHKYRQQFHDFQRDTAISDLEDSMIESAGDDHRTEQHLSTGERLSMGSHMSINSSGSSIANYAMDSSPAPFYQR